MMHSILRYACKTFVNKPVKTSTILAFPRSWRTMSTSSTYKYETLAVTSPSEWVLQVELNRPDKRNAMNAAFWSEMVECFNKIAEDSECRAVVLTGAGKMFTSGLDLAMAAEMMGGAEEMDFARKAFKLKKLVARFQESFTVIEKCTKPVIAAVHNGCVGGGVDMITACDIRYCTRDAWFQIKEVDIGLAADVGTLQRLPKVVGNESLVRELAFTARKLAADEAKECGLVSRVFEDRESMITGAIDVAAEIASKSPVAVQGSKVNLIYARDHSVPEALDNIGTWNMSMLQSEDLGQSVMAMMQKEKAKFSKL